VSESRIVFTGLFEDAKSKFPAATYKDLKRKTMLPGFIGAHSHFMFALNMVNQVNVAPPPVGSVTDIPSLIDALKKFQADRNTPEGEWIIGWGYDQDGLVEGRHITKTDIDAYFPDHRVMLIHVSSHGAVLNSRALEWAKIDATTATPVGGVITRMPGSQEPAGLLMETAYLPVFENLPKPTEAEQPALMDNAQMDYAREGYTHAQEGFTHLKDLDLLRKAAAQTEGGFFIDIAAMPGFTEVGEWLGNPDYKFGVYENGLKLQGMKIVQDGSPQGKTALFTISYLTGGPDRQENWYGESTMPYEKFAKIVKVALDANIQVFVHANGDGAIDHVIKAVDEAGITAEDDRRTVVMHSQFQRPDHLDDYLRLGLTPSYFTVHTFFWGDVHVANMGVEKAHFISPMNAAKTKGIIASNHTDFNVTPLDPMFLIWSSMARESRSGAIIGEDERVDAYTALQGLTTGPAYQLFEENRKGHIAEGLLADFVVLSANPLKTDLKDIRDITILETIKGGNSIYVAAEQ